MEGRATHQCWVELQGVCDSGVQSSFLVTSELCGLLPVAGLVL